MNKSQSLALVAVGVIAVLLVTAMVADPQDAMASKKHKKHHHHHHVDDGGASATDSHRKLLRLQQRVVADPLPPPAQREAVLQRQQRQPIRSAVVDSTKDKISFFILNLIILLDQLFSALKYVS